MNNTNLVQYRTPRDTCPVLLVTLVFRFSVSYVGPAVSDVDEWNPTPSTFGIVTNELPHSTHKEEQYSWTFPFMHAFNILEWIPSGHAHKQLICKSWEIAVDAIGRLPGYETIYPIMKWFKLNKCVTSIVLYFADVLIETVSADSKTGIKGRE